MLARTEKLSRAMWVNLINSWLNLSLALLLEYILLITKKKGYEENVRFDKADKFNCLQANYADICAVTP